VIHTKAELVATDQIHFGARCRVGEGVRVDASRQQVFIGKSCTLDPGCSLVAGSAPLVIGDYVKIGQQSRIEGACTIGRLVVIGDNVTISPLCDVRDCVVVENDSVLASGTVVAPFSVMAGKPAVCVSVLPPSAPEMLREFILS